MTALTDAQTALRTARMCIEADDMRGAGNRAYYAVFYAARALLESLTEIDAFSLKTHDGLRRMFEFHLVRVGLVSKQVATLFNDIQQTRWAADYTADLPSREEVIRATDKAESFVAACEALIAGAQS